MKIETDNIAITLSDAWYSLEKHGLRIGSPDVGMNRVQLIGSLSAWEAARDDLANKQKTWRGSDKTSATRALQRVNFSIINTYHDLAFWPAYEHVQALPECDATRATLLALMKTRTADEVAAIMASI